MSAVSDAQLLLRMGGYYLGEPTHRDQWRLDRARWNYQHARGMKRAALAELADMNAIRRLYASEGKPGNHPIPEKALRQPVGDQSCLRADSQPESSRACARTYPPAD